MAAAIVASGFLLLDPHIGAVTQAIVLVGAAAVGAHLALHRDGWPLRLWCLIPTALLTWAAAAGVFFLVLVAGGCENQGQVGPVSWIGGAAIYFAGAVWALQRPARGVLGVPASFLAGERLARHDREPDQWRDRSVPRLSAASHVTSGGW